jgi:hypothetical protein
MRAMACPGAAFTRALPEKVVVFQLEVPARRVETTVEPPSTKVPAGVATT